MPCQVPISKRLLFAAAAVAALSFPSVAIGAEAPAQAVSQVKIIAAPWDAENAPKSKYIKKVTETATTANLNLRTKASTSSASKGVIPKGSVVRPTGKNSGKWKELTWGSKRGWASGDYLRTRTYTKDMSARYMMAYTRIHETSAMKRDIGGVNFRTKVSLLEVKGSYSHIKTGIYHGWVPSKNLSTAKPAIQYRYVQKSGTTYSHWNPSKDKHVGRVHHGEKYEYRRWVGSTRRDEIKVNGKWVWTDVMSRSAIQPQYRYAQKNGTVYNKADKATDKAVGTIAKGTKVRWGDWDSKNRRDEVFHNGKWVWTDAVARTNPGPAIVDVRNYGRFTTGNVTLLKEPKNGSKSAGSLSKGMKVTVTHKADGGWVRVQSGSKSGYIKEKDNLRVHGPYSVAVYGTLRTGQSAYGVMGSFQQKNMDQRIADTSLYQLWNPNWTFLTNGAKSVVAEQFQYTDKQGPAMLRKLDAYESQLKYEGRPMYTRQKVTMSDKSQSWTYKTTPHSEKVVKNSGRYISSGDFLKRS